MGDVVNIILATFTSQDVSLYPGLYPGKRSARMHKMEYNKKKSSKKTACTQIHNLQLSVSIILHNSIFTPPPKKKFNLFALCRFTFQSHKENFMPQNQHHFKKTPVQMTDNITLINELLESVSD